MIRDFSQILKKPSEQWPGGLLSFLGDLKSRGFDSHILLNGKTSELRSAEEISLSREAWEQLSQPASMNQVWTPQSYVYLSKITSQNALMSQQKKSMGLLFVEKSRETQIMGALQKAGVSSPLVVSCDRADAAMDFFLRSLYCGAWISGLSQALSQTTLPPSTRCETGVVMGPDCEISESCVFESGVRIGARVQIGKNVRIGAHTSVQDDSVIGDHCQIGAHCSIGNQGFGFVTYPGDKHRSPRLHVGRVVLGSHIRMGAFCAVDRGVFEDTTIGSHSSFDNFVQIAHNCVLGERGVYCGFVGLSGSTTVGDDVTIAGMVGTKDHVTIGDRVSIAAQSGVSRNIMNDQVVKGYPPLPLKETLKIQTLLTRLPELFERLGKLEKS
jgi:UDP-3-O-[3-hydroxymyristoyl] glucosamine N-acyltransferase LpxD